MQSFPKPLNAKEEREYVRRCKAGDKEARDCLTLRNLRLVAYIAGKYRTSGVEMEDLISIGTIGLIKGLDSFQECKNIRLATYCARCVENEILMHLRCTKKSSRDVYLYDSIGADKEGNEIHLLDILEYEAEDITERITREGQLQTLHGYMQQVLTKREFEILVYRYGLYGNKEKTQREIATIYGISRSYVSRIEKKALAKLKKCYEKDL